MFTKNFFDSIIQNSVFLPFSDKIQQAIEWKHINFKLH